MADATDKAADAAARFDALSPDEQKLAVQALRTEALKRCAEDGLFFLNFVQTRDEVDVDNTVKAFPLHLDYVSALWREIAEHQKTVIAKSRQMMVSWIACAFAVWWARRRPNQLVIMQTQNDDDANKLVCMAGGDRDATYLGRCQFIERHLPAWLKLPIKENEGAISYPNGSMIEALPGGANKARSKVPSLYFGDEFAYQPEAKGVWTAMAPLVQKGSKVVLISTPNGAEGSMFFHLWHGTPYKNPTSG